MSEKDQTIASKEQTIAQNNQALREKEEAIAEFRKQTRRLEGEKGAVVQEKDREMRQKEGQIDRLEKQLRHVKQQLEESERVIEQFQRRLTELEQLIPPVNIPSSSKEQRVSIKLTWRKGNEAPCRVAGSHYAAIDNGTLYIQRRLTHRVIAYAISTSSWSKLPDSPTRFCPSVIINNLFTLVGGCDRRDTVTNRLFSLTGEGSGRGWTEEFPPMPTERRESTALCTGATLIVVGGSTV